MKQTYQHYFRHPYSRFKDYFKVSLRDFGFSRKMFSHLVDFNNNKKLNKIDRNTKMKRLIDLQNSNKFEFENVFISELRSIYHFDDHSKFEIPDFIGSIQSTYYINPFSKRIIVLLDSKEEKFKPIQCCRMRDKHLHSDIGNISFIEYSEDNFKEAASIININESSSSYDLFKHFIILHEMAHDTDYQNYILFKDYSEGFPILAETYCIAENDADILAILHLIKHYSMNQKEAKDLIQMILKFRSVINKSKYIDKMVSSHYVDSEFKHLTEPSLLILLGLVYSKDISYFLNLTNDEMILLSMKIIDKSRCMMFRKNCYTNMLPLNSDEFFEDVLSERFQTLFSYYLLSIYGYDKVMETSKLPYDQQLINANKFKDKLIRKLYDPIFDEVNADFRLKVSFEYSLLSDDDYYWLFELKFFEEILKEI